MSALTTKRLRREETAAEITRLKTELKSCLDERRKKDSREQYKTQLDRIEAQVGGAAEYLLCQLGQKVDLTRSVGEVYEQCSNFDRHTFWGRWV